MVITLWIGNNIIYTIPSGCFLTLGFYLELVLAYLAAPEIQEDFYNIIIISIG